MPYDLFFQRSVINTGLVARIGDPTAASIGLSMPVELLASRDVLLASSTPSQPPTAMLRQGTLLTPFLGIQCRTTLWSSSATTMVVPNQEPAVHLHKPQKKVLQIDVNTQENP